MTSQGHRYAQFQRALKTGNAHLALAAAADLRHVDLADALSLVLLVRDDDPLRFERAAVRWLKRSSREWGSKGAGVGVASCLPWSRVAGGPA